MAAGALIGKTFNNRYEIVDRIGIGGMAEVYRAEDKVLGRNVAIKVMLPQYAENPDFAARFKQEAAAAANLSSPYIVNIYDWGQSEGMYYIVMELVRGTDLKTGINKRGRINQRKVAEIGSQVCSALSVAHKQDIIHRDIKPQNIMVQPDGNVKVMDFGIARAKNSVKTQTSSVLGTAHYISPEQAQGKDLSGTSDIYSLGIVLFEAATGKLPFDGPDAVSVAMKQVNEPAPYPSQYYPDIDADLESIIMKAMAKNPRDRFESANDMRIALNDYLAGRPVHIGGVASAAKTAYLGNGVTNVRQTSMDQTMVMPVTETKPGPTRNYVQEPEDSTDKSSKKKVGIIAGIVAAAVVIVVAVCFVLFGSSGSKDVEVPDLSNMTVSEATSVLKEYGLSVGTTDKSYSSDAKSGQIISQDPKAGTKVASGSKVNLTVSLGAEEVIVPDLSKMTATEAQAALSKVGLTATAGTAEYSSDVDVNHVMSQSPKAGETVTKGTSVTYVLSLGAENISVPDVTGKSESAATEALKNAGFEVATEYEYSSSVSQGVVISQNPSGGKLEKGEKVTITVSQGEDPSKAQVDIPNVVGKTLSEARSALESSNFVIAMSSGSSTDSTAIVTAQTPTGTAQKGSTITLTTQAASDGDKTSSN